MATDPLDALRAPVVAREPRPEFVAELLRDLRAELAPLLVTRHLAPDAPDATEPTETFIDSEERTMSVATTTSPVTAGTQYLDAPAAIEWLVEVLGFALEERHDLPDGSVAHARLSWHGGQVFVSTRAAGHSGPWSTTGPASIALNTADPSEVDARYAIARAAGAEIILELHDAPYGSHQFSVRDPAGNLWTVGTYLPPISAS